MSIFLDDLDVQTTLRGSSGDSDPYGVCASGVGMVSTFPVS